MISQAKPNLFTGIKLTISDCKKTFKEGGLKAVIRRYGWRTFAFFFIYYLTRDLILYVLIPYLFTRHVLA